MCNVQFVNFTELCVYIFFFYLVCEPAVGDQQKLLLDTSVILKDNDEYVDQMAGWLKHLDFKWRLCYRASRDGWEAKDFHSNCDNKGPTVTVVKANDNIFGGFTDQNWQGTSCKHYFVYVHTRTRAVKVGYKKH